MIRFVTLNDEKKRLGSAALLRKLIDQLRLAEIDVVCCQGVQRTRDGKQDSAREIAESLHMTYSFSATKYIDKKKDENEKLITINGLSILTGSYVWMLSSGSFSLPGECPHRSQVAQFAVIRQNNNSLLVVNTEFSSIAAVQLKQLQALFSHQRLQERFEAVVLCSNGNAAVSEEEFQSSIAMSAYKLANETIPGKDGLSSIGTSLQQHSTKHANYGMIFTLIPKNQAPATVKIYGASAKPLLDSILHKEVEFKPVLAVKKNLFMFPLSYTEQWSGSRNVNRV